MGADGGAPVALGAVLRMPHGDIHRDAALFKGGRAGGHFAGDIGQESGDRQRVALQVVGGNEDIADIGVLLGVDGVELQHRLLAILGVGPAGGDGDLLGSGLSSQNRCHVHVHDVLSLGAVVIDDALLHILDGILCGNEVGQFEVSGLDDGVDPPLQTDLPGDIHRVTGIELDLLLGNGPLDLRRQTGL